MHIRLFIYSLLLLAGLLCWSGNTAAQEIAEEQEAAPAALDNPGNRRHVAKLNLLSPLNKSVSLLYEQALSPRKSLQLGVSYGRSRFMNNDLRGSITSDFRWYTSAQANALVGLYTGPYLKYQSITDATQKLSGETTATATYQVFGAGWLIGRQWIAEKGFTVDIYAGAGYNPVIHQSKLEVLDNSVPYNSPADEWKYDIRLGFVLGWAF
jgi:hypothetical protein